MKRKAKVMALEAEYHGFHEQAVLDGQHDDDTDDDGTEYALDVLAQRRGELEMSANNFNLAVNA